MRRAVFATLVLFVAPIAVSAGADGSAPEELLREVEALLAAPSPSRFPLEDAAARLEAAAGASGVSQHLLRRLAFELELLASGLELQPRGREQAVAGARRTLLLLRQKRQWNTTDGLARAEALVPPLHDACLEAQVLGEGTVGGSTLGATRDGSASCGASADSADVWYAYTAASDGLVTFDTDGSSLDTVLSLHAACPDDGGDYELTCNDDSGSTLGSLVARDMLAGETVLVRVSGASGATGSFQLTADPSAGGIAGSVTKEGSGEPRPGATVRLFRSSGGFVRQVTTDAAGDFLFGGLDAGDWYLQAFDPLLMAEIWDDHTCTGSCNVVAIGDPVAVVAGLVEDIDFALAAGGTIEGALTDADGGGPVFGNVMAYDASGALVESVGGNGAYRLDALPAGSYTVRTSTSFHFDELYDDIPCQPSCDVTAGSPVAVAAGSTTPSVDFVLGRLGSLSGTVTRATDGAPVFQARVILHSAGGTAVASAFTRPGGTYEITRLIPGDYFARTSTVEFVDRLHPGLECEPTCDVGEGTPIAVQLATETAGIDFSLVPLGRIEGRVTAGDSGLALAGQVLLYRSDGTPLGSVALSSGNYAFVGLEPGTYALRTLTTSPGYEDQLFRDLGCESTCEVSQGQPVVAALATITSGVDFSLTRCSAPSQVVVSGLLLFGVQSREACRTVVAGAGTTVAEGGQLLLTAGRSVVLADGFRVLGGGRLVVLLDPAVASD